MAKSFFLPGDDVGKARLLDHFAATLPKYAELLEVSAAEVASVQNDAAAFHASVQDQEATQNFAQQQTARKNLLRDGGPGELTPLQPPVLKSPDAPAVLPGIFPRFTALAQRLKKHYRSTPAILKDLGLVGAEQTLDPTSWKPSLSIQANAGRPTLKWTKGDAEALEIWVDRGDGAGFVFLAIDLRPDYEDTAPLPAPGQSAVWKYKAIYRLNDAQVGQWSDVITVTVGG